MEGREVPAAFSFRLSDGSIGSGLFSTPAGVDASQAYQILNVTDMTVTKGGVAYTVQSGATASYEYGVLVEVTGTATASGSTLDLDGDRASDGTYSGSIVCDGADTDGTFTPPGGIVGATSYDVPWSQVDAVVASQTLTLSNFRINIAGQNIQSFTTAPTAQFEYGVFTGLTFAADTSLLANFPYSSISATGLIVSAVLTGTTTTVTANLANEATIILDFSKMSFPTAAQGSVTWKIYVLTGTSDSATSTDITITDTSTPTAVRLTVEGVLKDLGLNLKVKGDGTTLEVRGPADKALKVLKITYTASAEMTRPGWTYVKGAGETLNPEFAWARP